MRDAAQDYGTAFHAELMETADGERTMAEPPPGWLRLRQDGTMHLLVQYGRKLVERKGTWGVADATFAGMREPNFRIKYELSGRPDHVLGSSGVLEFRWGGQIYREVDGVTRRFARLDQFGEDEARRGAEVLARTGESGSGPASGPGGGSRDPQGADPKTRPDSSQFSLPGTYVVAEESADALASKTGRKRSYELTLQKGGKFSIVYKDGSRTTRTTGTWEQEGDEIGLRATHVNGKPISTPKSTTISIQDDGTLLMDDVVLERK